MCTSDYSILIVDDELDIVHALEDSLRQISSTFHESVQLFTATSVGEAIEVIARNHVDAVFLDYHFEAGMTGLDFIDKAGTLLDNVLVIMMSSRPENELNEVILHGHQQLGSRFRFLRKSFEFIEIRHTYLEVVTHLASQPYPFPLAYAHSILLASKTPRSQISALRNLAHTVVMFSSWILLADASRLGLSVSICAEHRNSKNTVFDGWFGWLTDLLLRFEGLTDKAFVPQLLPFFTQGVEENHLNLLDDFFKFEDSSIDDWSQRDEEWFAEVAAKYRTRFNALYTKLSFISRYRLLLPEKLDFGEGETFEYEVRDLMASDARFKLSKLSSQNKLNLNTTYLVDPSNRCLSLHPFLVYRLCPTCTLNRLYLLDNADQAYITYSTICNHTAQVPINELKLKGDRRQLFQLKSGEKLIENARGRAVQSTHSFTVTPATDMVGENVAKMLSRIEEKLDFVRAEDKSQTAQVLAAVVQNRVEQADVTRMVTELTEWARNVQSEGLPLEPALATIVESLADHDHSASAYQYLQVAVPLIPGILTYNVELGSQHQSRLNGIWNNIINWLMKPSPVDD